MEKIQTILITGSEDSQVSQFKNLKSEEGIESRISTSIGETKAILSSPELNVIGLFVSKDKQGVEYIHHLKTGHEQLPGLPLYLLNLSKTEKELSPYKAKELGIRHEIKKEMNFEEMIEKVTPITASIELKKAIHSAIVHQANMKNQTVESGSSDFIRVKAQYFLTGARASFDVFIKLSRNKYIKITQAGDPVDTVRMAKYIIKGVPYFYLQKETQKAYVKYCEHVSSRILLSESFPEQLKTSQTLHFGDQISGLINEDIFNSEQLAFTLQFIRNLNSLIQSMTPKKGSTLESFLKDIHAYTHGVACSMIGGVMGRQLGFDTEELKTRLGLSCMFHDLGLKKLPPEISRKTEEQMTLKEKTLYRSHPQLSAEELKTLPEIHDSVVQAALHHHVRRGSLGFPVDIPFTKLNLMSQIVGFSNDFARLIEKQAKFKNFNAINEAKKNLCQEFSHDIERAFKELFPG